MAQVSIVTAARTEVAEQKATAVVLNPGAREFLPWWRLGGSKKPLSADAPEFVMAAKGVAAPAVDDDSAGCNAVTNPDIVVGTGRSSALNRQDGGRPRAAYKPSRRIQWQEAVRRTIFVKYIDNYVTEEMLATLFGFYGTVVDCRICGDPTSIGLRFGFVELQREEEARAALFLDGTMIGICPLKISPSKTAIRPINPRFLPQSEAEWEKCLRTIYCTNISKIVESCNLKAFCEAYFGKVLRLRLLDNDRRRSTNLAFIEFAEVDGAIAALGASGIYAGGMPIRICPSKTPIRNYFSGSSHVPAGSLVEAN
ncbi:hypothetical protein BS78_02G148800 [Paspalum vaginatum]|nr:hypothetical protein BS78_02G148800 [Paspalum vaginatum]